VYSRTTTAQNDSLLTRVFGGQATEGETSLRTDLTLQVAPALSLRAGLGVKHNGNLQYAFTVPGELRRDAAGTPQPLVIDTTFTALRVGSYLEAAQQVGSRVVGTLGVRADHFGFLRSSWRGAPRLSVSIDVGQQTTINASGGRYWQSPSFIWLAGDSGNATRLRAFRADQAVVGVQRLLRDDLKVQFEVYLKVYGDYPARLFRPQSVLAPSGFADARSDIPFGLEPLAPFGTGRSFGAEAFIQKRLSSVPLFGLASLSLNRTRFTSLDGVQRDGPYDTRLIFNAALSWRPSRAWEFGGRFRLATGGPSTPFVTPGPLTGTLDFSRYNAGPRLPLFHALDLRVDHRWTYRRRSLSLYLDIQNVYNRMNSTNYVWDERLGAAKLDTALGLLPTIGITFAL
jgi:hypothetical protein